MVRKRSRKYESDENDSDSDLDFDPDESHAPAPKKYSLRERKRAPNLTTDYDYYGLDDDDGDAVKQSSDDEDFEVEADVETARSYFEPDSGAVENSDGLIDFEDIIRADIVVNKNKIDYDNLIQKTEIKLTQPKKRGRKPKNQTPQQVKEEESAPELGDNSESSNIHMLTDLEKEDCKQEDCKQEDCKQEDCKQDTEVTEPEVCSEGQDELANGASLEKMENGDSSNLANNESSLLVDTKTSDIETIMLKPPIKEEEHKFLGEDHKTVDEEDDDVILLEEDKQDVIVLDD